MQSFFSKIINHLSINLPIHPCTFPFIHIPSHSSIHLPIHPSSSHSSHLTQSSSSFFLSPRRMNSFLFFFISYAPIISAIYPVLHFMSFLVLTLSLQFFSLWIPITWFCLSFIKNINYLAPSKRKLIFDWSFCELC